MMFTPPSQVVNQMAGPLEESLANASPHTDVFSDVDSGFGSSINGTDSSYATTIGSEVFSYVYENGRRYHSYREGIYVLPNDDREIERLDLYHHIFNVLLGGKLYVAPLGANVKRILDIGTGTGSWAIDMAEEFPDAEVIGNDLSKIQPPWVPPNCKFEVDDVESDWMSPKNYYDFIHARSLSGAFQNWELLLKRCFDHTTPGGYFEFHDYDAELKSATGSILTPTNSDLANWWSLVTDAASKSGRSFKVATSMKERMEKAGFVDVTQRIEMWPLGSWPKDPRMKEIGRWGKVGLSESLHAFASALLTRVLGWEDEDIKKLCAKALKEMENTDQQYHCHAYFISGRKPDLEEG